MTSYQKWDALQEGGDNDGIEESAISAMFGQLFARKDEADRVFAKADLQASRSPAAYEEAIALYTDVLHFASTIPGLQSVSGAIRLLYSSHLNIATCHLRREAYPLVIPCCDEAIALIVQSPEEDIVSLLRAKYFKVYCLLREAENNSEAIDAEVASMKEILRQADHISLSSKHQAQYMDLFQEVERRREAEKVSTEIAISTGNKPYTGSHNKELEHANGRLRLSYSQQDWVQFGAVLQGHKRALVGALGQGRYLWLLSIAFKETSHFAPAYESVLEALSRFESDLSAPSSSSQRKRSAWTTVQQALLLQEVVHLQVQMQLQQSAKEVSLRVPVQVDLVMHLTQSVQLLRDLLQSTLGALIEAQHQLSIEDTHNEDSDSDAEDEEVEDDGESKGVRRIRALLIAANALQLSSSASNASSRAPSFSSALLTERMHILDIILWNTTSSSSSSSSISALSMSDPLPLVHLLALTHHLLDTSLDLLRDLQPNPPTHRTSTVDTAVDETAVRSNPPSSVGHSLALSLALHHLQSQSVLLRFLALLREALRMHRRSRDEEVQGTKRTSLQTKPESRSPPSVEKSLYAAEEVLEGVLEGVRAHRVVLLCKACMLLRVLCEDPNHVSAHAHSSQSASTSQGIIECLPLSLFELEGYHQEQSHRRAEGGYGALPAAVGLLPPSSLALDVATQTLFLHTLQPTLQPAPSSDPATTDTASDPPNIPIFSTLRISSLDRADLQETLCLCLTELLALRMHLETHRLALPLHRDLLSQHRVTPFEFHSSSGSLQGGEHSSGALGRWGQQGVLDTDSAIRIIEVGQQWCSALYRLIDTSSASSSNASSVAVAEQQYLWLKQAVLTLYHSGLAALSGHLADRAKRLLHAAESQLPRLQSLLHLCVAHSTSDTSSDTVLDGDTRHSTRQNTRQSTRQTDQTQKTSFPSQTLKTVVVAEEPRALSLLSGDIAFHSGLAHFRSGEIEEALQSSLGAQETYEKCLEEVLTKRSRRGGTRGGGRAEREVEGETEDEEELYTIEVSIRTRLQHTFSQLALLHSAVENHQAAEQALQDLGDQCRCTTLCEPRPSPWGPSPLGEERAMNPPSDAHTAPETDALDCLMQHRAELSARDAVDRMRRMIETRIILPRSTPSTVSNSHSSSSTNSASDAQYSSSRDISTETRSKGVGSREDGAMRRTTSSTASSKNAVQEVRKEVDGNLVCSFVILGLFLLLVLYVALHLWRWQSGSNDLFSFLSMALDEQDKDDFDFDFEL